MNIGVYGIRCTANDKWYVGQTKDMDKRRYIHVVRLASGKHPNRKLQRDYDEFGSGCFEFVMLHECVPEELNEQEYAFMLQKNSLIYGYNVNGRTTRVVASNRKKNRRRSRREKYLRSLEVMRHRHHGHTFQGIPITTDFKTFDSCVKHMTA